MADMEKWYEAGNYIDEISLDDLEEVSGGRIKVAGYAALLGAIKLFKKKGKDKEYAMEEIKKGWYENCPYRTDFTDGTEEDLQKTLEFIDKNW